MYVIQPRNPRTGLLARAAVALAAALAVALGGVLFALAFLARGELVVAAGSLLATGVLYRWVQGVAFDYADAATGRRPAARAA